MFNFFKKKKGVCSKAVGTTYKNANGSSRQAIIKKYARKGNEVFIKLYEYEEGKQAFAVLAKKDDFSTQIGNLTANISEAIINNEIGIIDEIRIKEVTGGSSSKPTLGVNLEIFTKD